MDLLEVGSTKHRHPWELGRLALISWLIKNDKAQRSKQVAADIGSGDGFFIKNIGEFQEKFAIDTGYTADHEVVEALTFSADIDAIPSNHVDVVFMLDVLEHVEEEHLLLNKFKEKTKKNATLFVTVPAHQYLFTDHDVQLKHYRRYSSKLLLNVLRESDISVKMTYQFFFSLYLVRCAQKLLSSISGKSDNLEERKFDAASWKFPEDSIVTKTVTNILLTDGKIGYYLSRIGIKLPGLSIFATCEKN